MRLSAILRTNPSDAAVASSVGIARHKNEIDFFWNWLALRGQARP